MPVVKQIHQKESITPSYSKPDFNNPITSQIRFIRKKEVMHRTGLSSSSIYDLMAKGLFPQKITLAGGKSVAWLESEVHDWILARVEARDQAGSE
jgi:prophage regulatory protein